MNVCTDLFTSYAEKLGHNCSEEWSANPMGAAHTSMSNFFNFPLPRQKLFPEKSGKSDHLLFFFFFTVVSRSHTLKDGLWPLGMRLPGIQYSTFYTRRVTEGFSFFLCLFLHDIFTFFLYIILFCVCPEFEKILKKWTQYISHCFFEGLARAKFQMPSLLFIRLKVGKCDSLLKYQIKAYGISSFSSSWQLYFLS